MKKKMLIGVGGEKACRILLRSKLFYFLANEYDLVISSPAETSSKWKDEFRNKAQFFNEIVEKNPYKGEGVLTHYGINAVLVAELCDAPPHEFAIGIQAQAKREGIPIIATHDFIDIVAHVLPIEPDLFLCWGRGIKERIEKKRGVFFWDQTTEHSNGYGEVPGLPKEKIKLTGPTYFDDYYDYKHEIDKFKREFYGGNFSFLIIPNGEHAEWVYKQTDDFLDCAEKYGARVILKTHPRRIFDSWTHNLVSWKYDTVPFTLAYNPSFINKTMTVGGVKEYDFRYFHLDQYDTIQLGGLMSGADLCLSATSTTNIEAAMFGTPSVLNYINWFHPWKIRRDAHEDWINMCKNKYNCFPVATNREELNKHVGEILENFDIYKVGIKQIAEDFFGSLDGNASKRCFEEIQKFLE